MLWVTRLAIGLVLELPAFLALRGSFLQVALVLSAEPWGQWIRAVLLPWGGPSLSVLLFPSTEQWIYA